MTLLELVISITVLSMVLVVAGGYLTNSVKAYNSSVDNVSVFNKLRFVSERIAKELRNINHNGANYVINNSSATQFDFDDKTGNQVIIDYDGVTDQLSLSYTIPVVNALLADGITAFSFNYYTGDGISAPATNADIVFVEYSITMQENSTSYSSKSRLTFRDGS